MAAYKTDRQIFPNDPVVGPKTMARLDVEPALLSPDSLQARLARAEGLVTDMRALLNELSGLLASIRDGIP